ncbi:MAG: helix-turn-helix domain-containing protein [Prevotella sp.]|nr:helix-turn-helix domain-containing protein [Prevotella sp.]
MEQNKDLRLAWDFVENTGRSIFLTGKAGTGKTTFLKTIVERSRKRPIVVAPTGVAAINAGGVTIHSFFQLPLSPFVPGAKVESKFDFGREKRKMIASIDLLIIDEISMVRADLLDAIDQVLRRYRDRYLPFGGVQLLMIGDLAQLTPVVTPEDEKLLKPYYDTPYFFGSKALQQIDYVTIQLEHVYRQQSDPIFIDILNQVRQGHPTKEALNTLNTRYIADFHPQSGESFIRLTTHNRMADSYNQRELLKLATNSQQYEAVVQGNFPNYSYPTAQTLTLKQGAQVMFIKNDPTENHSYYNGLIGRVSYLDRNKILVRCEGYDKDIEVEQLEWQNMHYTLNPQTREIESEVQGTFKQYPLRLAWAITIHKSQGLTFDHAIIDAGYSFAPGQVYVALSRCRSLKGLVLAAPLQNRAIINDEQVDNYIAQQETATRQSMEQLPLLKQEYERQLLLQLFDFRQLLYQQESMLRLFGEFFYHSYADLTQLHAQTLTALRQRIMDVAEKWKAIITQTAAEKLHDQDFLDRVGRSAEYFASNLKDIFMKPLQLTYQVETNNKIAKKRLGHALPDLQQTWQATCYLLTEMAMHGYSVTKYLKAKQLSVLTDLEEKQKRQRRRKMEKAAEPPKPKTWEISMQLYKQGMNPDLIAHERGLTTATVLSHLARYIHSGEVNLDDLISPDHQRAIRRVIAIVGTNEGTTAIKSLCPPEITYDEIHIIMGLEKK